MRWLEWKIRDRKDIRYFPTVLGLGVTFAREYSGVRDECIQFSVSIRRELVNKGAYVLKALQLKWPGIHFNSRHAACCSLKDGLTRRFRHISLHKFGNCICLHFLVSSHLAWSLLVATSNLGCKFARCTEASNPSPTFDPVTRNVFELTSSILLG